MQKAVGYVRVSTEGQVSEGISLEAQQARISAWVELSEYKLEKVYIDAGLSGGRADNRPGLQDALTQACNEKAALVVYSLSRLARSTKDAIGISERLDKAGADLVSISERIDTTSAAGKMVFRMLAVLAEFERDQISERTTNALRHLKSKGKRVGTIPFGWDLDTDNKSLILNEEEQAVIALIHSLAVKGLSLRKIGRELEKRGIRTKKGGHRWTPKVIRGILKRDDQLHAESQKEKDQTEADKPGQKGFGQTVRSIEGRFTGPVAGCIGEDRTGEFSSIKGGQAGLGTNGKELRVNRDGLPPASSLLCQSAIGEEDQEEIGSSEEQERQVG